MTPELGWQEIGLRLFLTVVAGALVGINREEHGRAAGLRTTMLVCLAASLSMIQANLMLGMNGKSASSFVVMDLMRLPLGILSGIGFIGAGAILRKDNLVTGVTTAATLWFVTVLGLCLGGGQIGLGMTALAMALGILWGLKAVETRLHEGRSGSLTVVLEGGAPDVAEISRRVEAGGGKVSKWIATNFSAQGHVQEQSCRVKWRQSTKDSAPPSFLKEISEAPGVIRVEWKLTS